MSRRRSVLMRSRVANLLRFQICLVARAPYRSRSAEKSSSGSCISRVVLAAVLPRPTRPASRTATRTPAAASRHAAIAPVTPPPRIATSTLRAPLSFGYERASLANLSSSHNGRSRRSTAMKSDHLGGRLASGQAGALASGIRVKGRTRQWRFSLIRLHIG